jgi:hypothetical protein
MRSKAQIWAVSLDTSIGSPESSNGWSASRFETEEREDMGETYGEGKIRPWLLATSLNSRDRTGKRDSRCLCCDTGVAIAGRDNVDGSRTRDSVEDRWDDRVMATVT